MAVLYVIILLVDGRAKDTSFGNFVSVLLSGSSIVVGLNLIIHTLISINDNIDKIETEKIYTLVGGGTVIYIALQAFYSKVRKPIK